jgi:uncharacterized protein (TIGR03437 family)
MRSNLFKLAITLSFGALFVIYLFNGTRAVANQSGPDQPSRTGAPGELTCAVAQCHLGSPVNSGSGTLTLTGVPDNYPLGQEIDLTVTLAQAGRVTYGFQLTVIDDQGRKAGDLLVIDPSRTQKRTGVVGNNLREYIQHNLNGSNPNGPNQGSWTLRWRTPAQSVGRVTFYVAGNAGNGNGQQSGDLIYTISRSSQPASAVANVTSVSAASFAFGPLAAEAISAAFGTNLSQNPVSATTIPLPTELDGTRVLVNGVAASLFFVSPGQINYLVPAGTAPGNATVIVRRGTTDVAQGTVIIEPVAPALFTGNASGRGVAAAVLLRVKANGEQTFEPVAQLNAATNTIEAVPIDLGPADDQVFLIIYGSGFRRRSSLSAVTTTIGGENAEVLFAGASPDFVGLDQANIRLPRSLVERGTADVIFTVDGKTANTVTLNFK